MVDCGRFLLLINLFAQDIYLVTIVPWSCVLLISSVSVANLLSEHFSCLLFRLYNPRKLFSWQTLHDQTMNDPDFAACETTCVNITYPSADCRLSWPKISITSMRKFAEFALYILKCRVGPSFITQAVKPGFNFWLQMNTQFALDQH